MPPTVSQEQRQGAKRQLIGQIEQGASVQQARSHSAMEVRALLIEVCQATPSISSPVVQQAIQERFGLCISVSQLNRVRASLGLSRKLPPREKKVITTPTE